jgi:hypothetical protein
MRLTSAGNPHASPARKLLLWARPLAECGKLSQKAVDKILEGSGTKDAAGDVVALVTLYRTVWNDVQNMCGVTAADLDRGSKVAPAIFAWASRRDNDATVVVPDGSLRV